MQVQVQGQVQGQEQMQEQEWEQELVRVCAAESGQTRRWSALERPQGQEQEQGQQPGRGPRRVYPSPLGRR